MAITVILLSPTITIYVTTFGLVQYAVLNWQFHNLNLGVMGLYCKTPSDLYLSAKEQSKR